MTLKSKKETPNIVFQEKGGKGGKGGKEKKVKEKKLSKKELLLLNIQARHPRTSPLSPQPESRSP